MYTINDLYMTCDTAPSSWEGITDTGQFVYIRYRWGILYVYVTPFELHRKFKSKQEIENALECIQEIRCGGSYASVMSTELMVLYLRETFGFYEATICDCWPKKDCDCNVEKWSDCVFTHK